MAQSRKPGLSSSDGLVDKIFKIAIEFLYFKKYIKCVRKVTSLPDPDIRGKKKQFLCGYLDYDDSNRGIIYISNDKRKNKAQRDLLLTLIHEVCHFMMPRAEEDHILDLERMLWNRFSKKQKEILFSYIPKRFSKKRPSKD